MLTKNMHKESHYTDTQGTGKMRGARREVRGGYSARERARRHAIGRL